MDMKRVYTYRRMPRNQKGYMNLYSDTQSVAVGRSLSNIRQLEIWL